MNLDSPYNKRSIHAGLDYSHKTFGSLWHGWGCYDYNGALIAVYGQVLRPAKVKYGTWRKVKVSFVG